MSATKTAFENWSRAAIDLGFQFLSPFVLRASTEEFECFGCVPQFGGENGLVIVLDHYSRLAELAAAAEKNGYGCSCLFVNNTPYSVQDFIDVLNDWGWHRPNELPPRWYTGQPWTQS